MTQQDNEIMTALDGIREAEAAFVHTGASFSFLAKLSFHNFLTQHQAQMTVTPLQMTQGLAVRQCCRSTQSAVQQRKPPATSSAMQ